MQCSDDRFGPQYCNQFDFTLLFEQTVLQIVPCAVLILSLPLRAFQIRRWRIKARPTGRAVKVIALTILAITQLALLATWISIPRTIASIPAATLSFITALSLIYLSNVEHMKSVRPSTTISIYTLSSLILDIPQARTLWLRHERVAAVFTVGMFVKLVVLILETRQKHLLQATAPEVLVNIFNRTVLWWLNPLFWQGYRSVLTFKKLYSIDDGLLSRPNEEVFRKQHRGLVCATLLSVWPTILGVVVARLMLGVFKLLQPLLTQQVTLWLSGDTHTPGEGLIGATILVYTGAAILNVTYKRGVDRLATKIRCILIAAGHKKALNMWSDDGAVFSLLSTDSIRICTAVPVITEVLASPLEIIGASILLNRVVGIVWLAPFLLSVVVTLVSFGNLSRSLPYQKRWLAAVQARVAYTAAVLRCPKGFKMMGLTGFLTEHIQSLRIHELTQSASYRRFVTLRNALGWSIDDLAPVTTLTVFALRGGDINPTTAFTTLSLVTILCTPIHDSILAIPEVLNAATSFDRIEMFLQKEDRTDDTIEETASSSELVGLRSNEVRLESAVVQAAGRTILDVSIDLQGFTMIIGPVGSGKSTLLRALIGDVKMKGRRHAGEFAYCAQEVWLPNVSIREAITGLTDFDQEWYQTIIQACALAKDIDTLSNGDDSPSVGLSGGQKQRVAVARALYCRKKVLILDDPTSGLDYKTSARLLQNLQHLSVKLSLTVVMATHALHHLHFADHVISLRDGKIVDEGPPTMVKVPPIKEEMEEIISTFSVPPQEAEDLTRQTGDITVYKHYAKSIGLKLGSMIIVSALTFAFGRKFPELWVRWWTEQTRPLELWIGVYYLLGLVSITSVFAHLWIFLVWTIPKSSAKLHKDLLDTVMQAPYSFWTTTDSGTTLNRFANDMSQIEVNLAGGVVQTLLGLGVCIGAAMLIAAGADYAGTTIPFILAILYFLQKFYLRTSRQLRLMDLEAQSPLFAHIQETLAGVATIRAFGWQDQWHEKCLDLLDRSQRPYYLLLCVQRWLNLVLDLVTSGMAVVVVSLATTQRGSAGSVGVSLLNILSFNTQLSTLIVAWTALETSLGAVARCKKFGETPAEPSGILKPELWPQGEMVLKNVTAGYTTPVLKDICLTIRQGTKVGICGRSGSGKSTLLLAMLQMIECRGIEVDGVDLADISREFIRQRFTALPQDTLVLPGNVRANLNPEGQFTEDELNAALQKVGLDIALDGEMTLSQGEMQLFAVARALLRPSKIVLVDEMTSSVDEKTEARMMAIISQMESTVIAVAHRLQTIIDFDMIVVMHDGRVVECGAPAELLKADGWFKSMWESGAVVSGHVDEDA